MFQLSQNLITRLTSKLTSKLLKELHVFQVKELGENYLNSNELINPNSLDLLIPFNNEILENGNTKEVNRVLLTLLHFYVAHEVAFEKDLSHQLNIFLEGFSSFQKQNERENYLVTLDEKNQVKIGESKRFIIKNQNLN